MKPLLARLAVTALAATAVALSVPVPGWSARAATPSDAIWLSQPAMAQSHQPVRRPHPHRRPWPITITVQTVPALPGIRLTFDGRPLVTNRAGRASYTAEHNFARHTLSLLDTAVNRPDRRYRFARWAGQRDPNQAFRSIVTGLPMRANYTVTAAFTVQYPVTARLVDQQGSPLDLARVSAVTVKSDAGQVLRLPKTEAIWLDGVTPQYRKSALVQSTVYYSVQSLTMSGTNIVDAGKQRFTPASGSTVVVTGQLHDLTVVARDALFRDGLGTSVVVTGPDGAVVSVPFTSEHSATLRNLPRGAYHVTVSGAGGLVLDERFALSRDKALRIAVLSNRDLATIATAVLLVAAALLLAGRRWLRSGIARTFLRIVGLLRPLPPGDKAPAG